MKNITIITETENLDATAPLYCKYEGECQPQRAYVSLIFNEIDADEIRVTVSADYNSNPGNTGMTQLEHDNREHSFEVNAAILGSDLKTVLESDDFKNDVKEIAKDYSEEYRDGRYVGIFAQEEEFHGQLHVMEECFRELECAEIYEAEEWFADSIEYFDIDGDVCGKDEAVSFRLDDETHTKGFDDCPLIIAAKANICPSYQIINDIEEFFGDLAETISYNLDYHNAA